MEQHEERCVSQMCGRNYKWLTAWNDKSKAQEGKTECWEMGLVFGGPHKSC